MRAPVAVHVDDARAQAGGFVRRSHDGEPLRRTASHIRDLRRRVP
jgi:hypothetical protein